MSPNALSTSSMNPFMPSPILFSLLSNISKGVNALLTISDICPDINSLIVPSISACKSVILVVRLSRLLVNSPIVFVFCNIASGELGRRGFNVLIFLVVRPPAPNGFNPVASAAKSAVNSIGRLANFVSVSLMSVPMASNFARISLSTLGDCSSFTVSIFSIATLSAAPAWDKV